VVVALHVELLVVRAELRASHLTHRHTLLPPYHCE
jgi:hypothetical protein